ncbi:hypothetical protein EVAR_42969_1 [Eumeta japonica]|uniref:Uncharacterized protein n=1 Tax=Eumeta variegata TaxID=151549 RepID=A0A4C1ZRP5_EUMVA|nr:hypothetical protein EVAR_42969_1 [Eumeta japonica]
MESRLGARSRSWPTVHETNVNYQFCTSARATASNKLKSSSSSSSSSSLNLQPVAMTERDKSRYTEGSIKTTEHIGVGLSTIDIESFVQYNARNSAAVKLVAKAPQRREIRTRGGEGEVEPSKR